MSCKDILPQIRIEAISVKEQPFDASIGGNEKSSFSNSADEKYQLAISHTNIIQIDNFLDTFSFGDLIDAEVLSPSLYNIKFLLTDDPDVYQLINDSIDFIKAVEYLGEGLTSEEILNEKNKLDTATTDNTPATSTPDTNDAPAAATAAAAADKLNKCSMKVTNKKEDDKANTSPKKPPTTDTSKKSNKTTANNKLASTKQKQAKTFAERIIKALTDNNYNQFSPRTDKLFSFVKGISVDQKKITLQGYPPVSSFINSDFAVRNFYDSQLKNLYLVAVPNVEYRENNKIIFAIRQFMKIPLVLDFAPQKFGGLIGEDTSPAAVQTKNQKEVNLEFLNQSPVFTEDKLLSFWTDTIKKIYGDRAYKTFTDNQGVKPILTEPLVSLNYNNSVNGVFFLDSKHLAENLTVFGQTLEQPQLYKDLVQNIIVKKVYEDGTEDELTTVPATNINLEFQSLNNNALAYRFVDTFYTGEFKYKVVIKAKNPLEGLLQYVMPKIVSAKQAATKLEVALTASKKIKNSVVFNPVSGYFTDDFLASSAYKDLNSDFVNIYQSLYNLYNFLLYGEPFKKNSKKLTSIGQFQELQNNIDIVIDALQKMASTEGIHIAGQSTTSSKKNANKQHEPYKTIEQSFDKPYYVYEARLEYDFLFSKPPPAEGFIVSKQSLINRVNVETDLIKMFDETTVEYGDNEAISISPLSVIVDKIQQSLIPAGAVTPEELETEISQILMSAQAEIVDPLSTFTENTDSLTKILEAENTTVTAVADKKLTVASFDENFISQDLKDATPTVAGNLLVTMSTSLAINYAEKLKKAQGELGEQFTKSLYLDAARQGLVYLSTTALAKFGFGTAPSIDKKHSFITTEPSGEVSVGPSGDDLKTGTKTIQQINKIIENFYKQYPSIFMTRFMNAYQLEYVASITPATLEYNYKPLTKSVIDNLPEDESLIVTMRQKAGIPIPNEGKILNSTFLLSNPSHQSIAVSYEFLPNLKIKTNSVIKPSEVTMEQISKDLANPVNQTIGSSVSLNVSPQPDSYGKI